MHTKRQEYLTQIRRSPSVGGLGTQIATACLTFACLFVAGCQPIRNACKIMRFNSTCDRLLADTVAYKEGCESWAANKCNFKNRGSLQDVRRGFLKGYQDTALGGDGRTPIVPEERYWSTLYQSRYGQQRINAWYQGYPMGVAAARQRGHGYFLRTPVTEEVSAFFAASTPQGRAAGLRTPHQQNPVPTPMRPQPDTLPGASDQRMPVQQQFIEEQFPGQEGVMMHPPGQNQFANGQIIQEYIELPIEQPVQTQGDQKLNPGATNYQDFDPLEAVNPSTRSFDSLPSPVQTDQTLDSASLSRTANELGQLSKLPSRDSLRDYLGLPTQPAQQPTADFVQQQTVIPLPKQMNPFTAATTQAVPVSHQPVVELKNSTNNPPVISLPTRQVSSPFEDFPDALLPGN